MPKTAERRSDAVPSRPEDPAVTIGGLVRAADWGSKQYGITSVGVCLLSHIAPAARPDIRPP
jgi:hypothetical protein